MNDRKTSSMLHRVPVILAVTAASYGLQLPPSVARLGHGGVAQTASIGKLAGPQATGQRQAPRA